MKAHYKTVGEYCMAKIPQEYHGHFLHYGEWDRTDVEQWIRETMMDSEVIIARDLLNVETV